MKDQRESARRRAFWLFAAGILICLGLFVVSFANLLTTHSGIALLTTAGLAFVGFRMWLELRRVTA